MPQIRITNISADNPNSPGKGFGCWFSDRFLKPGESAVIDEKDLPHDWRRLCNIFRFEELRGILQKQEEALATNSILEALLQQQTQLLKKMESMQTQLNEQPQVQVIHTPGLTQAPKANGLSISKEVFISEIGSVETQDIRLEGIETEGPSLKNIKAKLAKLKNKE